jgi:deoxyribonuclease V
LAPPRLNHPWNLTVPEARELQEKFRKLVVTEDRLGPVRRVAGVDVSYDQRSPVLFAAVVVLRADTLERIETVGIRERAGFPYVPGYLSFREAPAVLRAFAGLRQTPDLLICDGHGVAHPRRFGLACHLGLWLDLPTIGCAKSRLIGSHAEPAPRRGSRRRLIDAGEIIGEVVRTRDGVRPVYVSVGHRISLPTARRWILRLARGVRLPEPVRAAHLEVNRMRSSDHRGGRG